MSDFANTKNYRSVYMAAAAWSYLAIQLSGIVLAYFVTCGFVLNFGAIFVAFAFGTFTTALPAILYSLALPFLIINFVKKGISTSLQYLTLSAITASLYILILAIWKCSSETMQLSGQHILLFLCTLPPTWLGTFIVRRIVLKSGIVPESTAT